MTICKFENIFNIVLELIPLIQPKHKKLNQKKMNLKVII